MVILSTVEQSPTPRLDRGMGLPGAVSANILNMVGVGPFLTIPLAISAMGGPQAMLGWILGAILCLCDGMVWAELGSRFPRSGGPYHYLLQGFGAQRWGRLLAFLFLWQSLLIGPISVAGGAVGFSDYTHFLAPTLSHTQLVLIAMALCLVTTVLLYRPIRSISMISLVVSLVVVGTCMWIIVSGALRFQAALAFDLPHDAFRTSHAFWMGLGSATLIGVYDYGGYNNVCLIGEEIANPRRTIPRAVIGSIALVALLYLAMNVAILGVVPWREGMNSTAVVADYMQRLHGHTGAVIVSSLILVASFGSVYAILLGFSRVPYTAAVEGHFFRPFARLHPTGHFPTISLLTLGALSAVACLFSLADLIGALIVVQTMFQFATQCIAVILLRRHPEHKPSQTDSYRMPFYPVPALIALVGWIGIVISGKLLYIALGFAMAFVGVALFLLSARRREEWPFQAHETI